MIRTYLESLLGVTAMDRLYRETAALACRRTIFRKMSERLGLGAEINPAELARVPRTGGAIVVANHPTGAMEGIVLPALLDSIRDDVMVLAHAWFERWPLFADRMIMVEPQARPGSRDRNRRALARAADWVRRGGTLVMFPAGEVARFDPRRRAIAEQRWHRGLAQLVQRTGAPVVPVHVSGRNGLLFQLLSLIQPRLGAVLLGRELLAKRGRTFRFRIGEPLRSDGGAGLAGDADPVERCREAVAAAGAASRLRLGRRDGAGRGGRRQVRALTRPRGGSTWAHSPSENPSPVR
jgi:putative hemolysin